ncbi:flagellar protein FlbD [Borrelia miyamotoi]|uniref:Flagellar FlbD family protein n=1 Tax=Borrelia miyamotoi TaxID=47466 RepID=A0AAP8YRX6_9SPIR|nr:flagellar FlbD family protein [Borrelia miyamotoi]AHH05132.1 Flagellar protein flbD [Borrelia miyamotoi FR64b]ATQ14921.1 flagellar FlbD family protein [Borrelia miyamotoi]ATQ16104.1 flagellar FlbD family protein [Borrelia miyamotoi]ATQ17249.1 flagellar FlbD family protein [Borrelia miyamotoi]ATQ18245.1 flagellar FlbD family protein [Borrelia miyamotoi]
MIYVTKLNGDGYYLNPCHIESIEANPDTTILLMNGKKVVVKENVVEVVDKIRVYRREITLIDRVKQEDKGVRL